MAAESRFAEVSDEYLSSLLEKSIPKSKKESTKYGMKIFNGTGVATVIQEGVGDDALITIFRSYSDWY